jgi:plasmid stabilization system protein ParE
MKVIYTDDALDDLEFAYDFIARKWPDVLAGFERRLVEIEGLVSEHSESGHILTKRPGVRSVAFAHYPYLFYYRIKACTSKFSASTTLPNAPGNNKSGFGVRLRRRALVNGAASRLRPSGLDP